MALRDEVIAACTDIAAAISPLLGQQVTQGGLLVRRGRWMITDTSVTGLYAVVEVAVGRRAISVHVGPVAPLRNLVPASVRAAWVAGQYGESDADP